MRVLHSLVGEDALRPVGGGSARLASVKGAGREPSGMFVLAESASIPANAAGIVVGVLGLVLTAAWVAYLYR